MRKFITICIAAALVLPLASCTKDENKKDEFLAEFISSIDDKKTEITLDEAYLELDSDITDNSCIYAVGSNGDAGFELAIHIKSVTKINKGTLIAPTLVNFYATIPSVGAGSAYFYSGKVTMTDKTADKVTFIFEDVKFELSIGEIKLNGKLVCPVE